MNPHDTTPHEFMDATITVKGFNAPEDEQKLHAMLDKLEGVKTVIIAGGKVTVEYDPMQVTKTEIAEAMARMGFGVEGIESAPASPISDALHGHQS